MGPTGSRPRSGPLISILVPTLHEEQALPETLDHLAGLHGRFEVVVCDGGSRDATVRVAREHAVGARVLQAGGGRAAQGNAAAGAASGDVLLFLHADSRLPVDAYASLAQAWREGAAGGNFALRFDGGDAFATLMGRVYAFQRRRGFYYGDSSVWLRREAWTALGGFRELPIMDDYDLVRRLERHGPTRCLPGPATTSDRRWREMGVARTLLSWWVIRWLYVAGIPPQRLVDLYRVVR
ncbi:MAG: TIGR04283 family arsenosugar biosynthesis glycosyltransferase [Actinomycetota bacterium]|nr:TIGR04283 family arsenosugar biosynthesis glycosyltransferase [Actinomycetota bacterium]